MNTQCSLVYLYLHLQLKSSDRLHSFNPYGTAKPPVPPPPTPTSKENQLFSWLSADVQSTPFIAGTIGTSKSESRNSGSLFQSNICNSFLPGIQLLSILWGVHYSGVPVAGPDLQIRGGHPDPEMGGTASKQIFFSLQMPHFGLKIRGARAPRAQPLDPPLGTARRDLTAIALRHIVNQSGKINIPTIPEESSMKPYLLPCWYCCKTQGKNFVNTVLLTAHTGSTARLTS